MTFATPWVLLLLPLPWIVFVLQLRQRRGRGLPTPKLGSLPSVHRGWFALSQLPTILLALSWTAMVVALARPQSSREAGRTYQGLDIVLTVDTSGSMAALDFVLDDKRVNRLQVVQHVLDRFVPERSHDRLGLVVFGSGAFTQVPLTLDHDALRFFLSALRIGVAGDETAIGEAIAVATKRLAALADAKSRVAILLTDGTNTAGKVDPIVAAEGAAALGIKIYTIGVGSHDPVPFPVDGPFGPQIVHETIPLDEATLQRVAELTGGQYFLASTTDDLSAVYAAINDLETTEGRDLRPWAREDHYRIFVLIALLLLCAEALLRISPFWPLNLFPLPRRR